MRFMYHRAGLERTAVVRRRSRGAHGRRPVPGAAALREERGDPDHALQDLDRLLREHRLDVGHHDRRPRAKSFTRDDRRSRPNAPYGMYDGAVVLNGGGGTRWWCRCRWRSAATADAGRERQASPARLTFGGDDAPRAQSDLLYDNGSLLRCERLDVACRSRVTGASSTSTYRKTPADGTVVPGRHDVGTDARSVHRPGHVGDGPLGQPRTSSRRLGSAVRRSVHPRHGREECRTPICGSGTWGFDTATGGAEDVVDGTGAGRPARARAARRAAGRATSSTPRSRCTLGSCRRLPDARSCSGDRRQRLVRRDVLVDASTLRRPGGSGLRPQPAGDDDRVGPPGRSERPGYGEREEEDHDLARVAGDLRGAPAEQRRGPVRPQGRQGDRLLDHRVPATSP